ncbi:MAG: threonine/serine exporter family protein [Defluviitaleaceae bacterium]|nr:threonine/serine exporter family protein [Defluviitaleaceae bacterium]
MILSMFLSAIAVMGFSIIFNVPRKELIFCGLTGIAGWIVLTLITSVMYDGIVAATFLASITVTTFSRILSSVRKMPSTIYMIPGIIPLVPGLRIYFTMFYAVSGELNEAVQTGITAITIAGVIAVGLLIVLSLPRKWFSFGKGRV